MAAHNDPASTNYASDRTQDAVNYMKPRPEEIFSKLEYYRSDGPHLDIDMPQVSAIHHIDVDNNLKIRIDCSSDLLNSYRNCSQNDSDDQESGNHSQYDSDNFDPDPYLHSSNYFRPISEIYDPNSDLSKLADQFKLLSIGSDDPNPEFEIDHISQAETFEKLDGSYYPIPNPDPDLDQLCDLNQFRSNPDKPTSESILQLDGNVSPFNDSPESTEASNNTQMTDRTITKTDTGAITPPITVAGTADGASVLNDSSIDESIDSTVSTSLELKDIQEIEIKRYWPL